MGASHDWDQMEEADGNSDIKVSADEKWGRQSVPVTDSSLHLNYQYR